MAKMYGSPSAGKSPAPSSMMQDMSSPADLDAPDSPPGEGAGDEGDNDKSGLMEINSKLDRIMEALGCDMGESAGGPPMPPTPAGGAPPPGAMGQ